MTANNILYRGKLMKEWIKLTLIVLLLIAAFDITIGSFKSGFDRDAVLFSGIVWGGFGYYFGYKSGTKITDSDK